MKIQKINFLRVNIQKINALVRVKIQKINAFVGVKIQKINAYERKFRKLMLTDENSEN